LGISVKLTGGAEAVILFNGVEGDKPLIGAYKSKKGWIPISWTIEGRYFSNEASTLLDIGEDDKAKIKET
jgi:hypothetical protein